MKLHMSEQQNAGTTLCGRPVAGVLTLPPIHWHRADCKRCMAVLTAQTDQKVPS